MPLGWNFSGSRGGGGEGVGKWIGAVALTVELTYGGTCVCVCVDVYVYTL